MIDLPRKVVEQWETQTRYSNWQDRINGFLDRSVLGLELFTIFITELNNGVESHIIKFI